jgi:hypothetical protein
MSDMEKSYQLAVLAVRQRLQEQRPAALAALSRLQKGDVAVYSGSFDQVEKLLALLKIPVTLDPDPKKLSAKIAFANCSNQYKEGLVQSVATQVKAGMLLVSSDWSLDHLVEKAFPGQLRWNQKSSGTEVISVEPSTDSTWSDIVVLGADPQWWLWGSHPIEVLNHETVRVEAASHDLLVRYGAPVVAARFDWHQGQVFHVISHFWAKSTATPTLRHTGPCTDFLRAGMKLSEEGINLVLQKFGSGHSGINFGMLQSAVTATELIAQLCAQAAKA